jgi:hypothetical protein
VAAIPVHPDPTLQALRAALEARAAAEEARPYLGMSAIGHPCERRLWYGFRWAARERMDSDSLLRINDGHRSEDVMAEYLRLVPGVKLQTRDPRTGQQFGFVDLAGHFRGHADGMIQGLLQASGTQHVWEAKATNEKKVAALAKAKAEKGEKQALKVWDAIYHAQAILYMAYSGATRHYLTCASPGVRGIESVRTDTDLDEARRLREKAERIITAPEPPPKISEDPAWYECKWCPAQSVCHRKALPKVTCRSCAHATPEMDGEGRWSCAWHRTDLSVPMQQWACDQHRYIPALVTIAEPVDASADENWIEYRMPDGTVFRNGAPGPGSYPSRELAAGPPELLCDPVVDKTRDLFGAELTPVSGMPE